MRGMLIAAGREPVEIKVDGFDDIKRTIGTIYITTCGWIFEEDDIDVIVSDEWMGEEVPVNRYIYAEKDRMGWTGPIFKGDVVEAIYGDFICLGLDNDDWRSLTDEEVEKVKEKFKL